MAGQGVRRPTRGRQGALLGLVLCHAPILTVALTALPAARAPHHLERGRSLALTSSAAPAAPALTPPTFPSAAALASPGRPAVAAPSGPRLTRQQVSEAALAMIRYP